MIEHLAVLVDTFPGAANQTRCFAHILNLVVKSILRQFEGPKKGRVGAGRVGADVATEIDGDNDNDDEESDSGSNEGGGNECEDVDDDVVDDDDDDDEEEVDEMSEEELLSVKEKVRPIRLVLTKVC